MNKIDVLYTTDKKYFYLMLISINSLLLNNKHLKEINIHIIFEDLSIEELSILNNLLNEYNNCNLFLYDYKLIDNKIEKYNLPKWRNSSIANARLFFTSVINSCDNLLYLDSDTIILDKLDKLEEYKDNTVSAVLDHLSESYWSSLNNSLKQYCNSGVLWINRNNWEKVKCDDLITKTIKDKPILTYPDQDILNIALHNHISLLPPNFNLSPNEFFYNNLCLKKYYAVNKINYYDIKEVISAKKNPIIIHFTEFYGKRPWIANNIYPLNNLFNYYKDLLEKNKNNTIKKENINNVFKIVHYIKMYTPSKLKDEAKKILVK
ncbi:MAG: glycosyltransferase [Bacilli bacterium]|nr:glycosyltransferase [Bacilli bacterium]